MAAMVAAVARGVQGPRPSDLHGPSAAGTAPLTMNLSEQLTRPEVQPKVIDGCVALIEREVDRKRGLSGAAVKAGFGVVSKVKPGFIREVVTKLLPDFAAALQPLWDESAAKVGPEAEAEATADFVQAVNRDRTRAAEALLGVTDRKIDGARPAIRKAYGRLRPNARQNVEDALPGLLDTIRPHLS